MGAGCSGVVPKGCLTPPAEKLVKLNSREKDVAGSKVKSTTIKVRFSHTQNGGGKCSGSVRKSLIKKKKGAFRESTQQIKLNKNPV